MHYKHVLSDEDQRYLDSLYKELRQASASYSGYPASLAFDYSELFRFLDMHINNIGDPYEYSNFKPNTYVVEREVIDYFACLLHNETEYRGYVTNGGTEGNLFGLHLGYLHYPNGIIYYSESSHYSIEKIIRLIKADSVKIRALDNGEINYRHLRSQLEENKHRPPIFLLNIGTTMKGAIDNINIIKQQINELNITEFYMHSDAALFGNMLPYIKNPQPFDFAAGVDSIAISGHKFIGSPIPCGIAIVKSKYIQKTAAKIAYVDIVDNTISGSRNGITPLFLWYAIKRYGTDGFTELVNRCLINTCHIVKSMNTKNIAAWSNLNSNIVVFPKPSNNFVKKWQIATYGDIAHLVIMPHHNQEFFDTLIAEI